MGGIGKTTLAQNIYKNQLIVHHFDILAWVTISQEYCVPEILRQVLCQGKIESEMSEDELGERVHKMLWGRRYLIVMDDIWSVEALDKVRLFFPDRIMITTTLSNLAFELSGSHAFQMKFLDADKSWGLLCEIVFGKKLCCPIELEKIGKKIARKCRGLPLSIVVIGGILKKSNWRRAYWEYTLQNLNLLINLEKGEHCLQILRTSYVELPIHLKPCFLYMGIFAEDHKIRVTQLIELWVAEGILKPTKEKRLEEVAEESINELIDRNLIFVDKFRWNGKAKVCKIHDLLKDLCLREVQKQRFLCVLKHHGRRFCIHDNRKEIYSPAFESASLTSSLISTTSCPELVQSLNLRLLRVYSGDHYIHCGLASAEAIFKRANLRLLTIVLRWPKLARFPSSWFPLWNLQTLKVTIPTSWYAVMAPSEIWEMPLLRHVVIKDFQLPDPVCGENGLILEDLLTISCVKNFKLSYGATKRIPNLETLRVYYELSCEGAEYHNFGLNNFGHLTKLQSLTIYFNLSVILDGEIFRWYLMQNLSFPHSLKKLTLGWIMLKWEECMTMIGSLPLLEYLRLARGACCGPEWETVEGQFCSLRFLQIDDMVGGLRYWRTDSTHFPRLEHLHLRFLRVLEEIPSSIGDIPTLKSIQLFLCSESAADSARGIKEEQWEVGNIDLQVHIFRGAPGFEIPTHVLSNYINELLNVRENQREKHEKFVDAFHDYKAGRIDHNGFIRMTNVVFKEHPNLIVDEISTLVRKGAP